MNNGLLGHPIGVPRAPVVIGTDARTGDTNGYIANMAYATVYANRYKAVINRLGLYVSASVGNIELAVTTYKAQVPDDILVTTGIILCPAAGFREIVIPDTVVPAGLVFITFATSSASTGVGYSNYVAKYDFVNSAIIAQADTTKAVASGMPLRKGLGWSGGTGFPQSVWARYAP